MKQYVISLCILFVTVLCSSAQNTEPTTQQESNFSANQGDIDKSYGAIGPLIHSPAFGKNIDAKLWHGVSIISDYFEIQFSVGENNKLAKRDQVISANNMFSKDYGYQFYLGGSLPINRLTFGATKSPTNVFRGHPVLNGGIGVYRMRDSSIHFNEAKHNLFYLGLNPGYRLKFPLVSIEFNLNVRLGFGTLEAKEYYRSVGISPSVTLRFDALKWFFDPSMVKVNSQRANVSNVQSKTTKTGTRYSQDGSKVEYYTSQSTADISVTSGSIGFQDIGPHIGIGPKVTFMSNRLEPYIPTSNLFGLVVEGRANVLDFGLTLEGGKVGHGSELMAKDVTEGKYRKRLNKKESFGKGTLSTINLYTNFGFDVSSVFLGLLTGVAADKEDVTSFLGISAGFILGGHLSSNQTFIDPAVEDTYEQLVIEDEGRAKEKFINPSAAGPGFLGGFYLSVQVGALNFKVENLRYYGAPFASTRMYSIAYRIPLYTAYR